MVPPLFSRTINATWLVEWLEIFIHWLAAIEEQEIRLRAQIAAAAPKGMGVFTL